MEGTNLHVPGRNTRYWHEAPLITSHPSVWKARADQTDGGNLLIPSQCAVEVASQNHTDVDIKRVAYIAQGSHF